MIVKQATRNLLSNKLRLFLTSLAVVLGVGFVTGAFVLGDTINRSFDSVFSADNSAAAVQVRGKAVVSDQDRPPVPDGLLATVRGLDGVETAEGSIVGQAQITDAAGDAVGGQGPPTLGFNWVDGPINPMRVTQGRPPRADNEVLLDEGAAEEAGVAVGGMVTIVTDIGPARYRLVGVATFGQTGETAGATLAFFTPAAAARLFSSSGRYATIDVVARPGVTDEQLASRINAVLPSEYEAVTTAESSQEAAEAFQVFVDIFRNVLLGFAGISLFVGAFIIFNAFQITVAQRGRQIGLLRTQGATAGQIVNSVLLEAALVAVAASVLGVLFGVFVAWGLQALFSALGVGLPSQALVIAPRSIIIGLAVGIVITVASALGPAYRSSRVPPIAALQPVPEHRQRPWAVVVAVLMFVGGGALVAWGTLGDWDTTPRVAMMAIGAMLLFFGAAALTQYIARPLASGIGAVFDRLGGRVPVHLGRRNAMRNPHRTAQTASALTIGVALVAAVSIFAASLHETFVGTIEQRVSADVIAFSMNPEGFSTAAEDALKDVDGLAVAMPSRSVQFKGPGGDTAFISGLDPSSVGSLYDPGVEDGSLAALARPGTVAVARTVADDEGLAVGDTLPLTFAATGRQPLTVVAIYRDTTFGSYFMDNAQVGANSTRPRDQAILAQAAPGASPEQAKEAVEKALDGFPSIDVYTKQGYLDLIGDQVNQTLVTFYMLLAMAVIIAVFGIVLTLALSVFERTREIGLLRAVGLSRRGTRAMIRWEAVIVSLIGALVGLVVGTFLGLIAVRAFPDLTATRVPWGQMVVFVVLAALAGVLAAILPARRAGKLNVLEAIATE